MSTTEPTGQFARTVPGDVVGSMAYDVFVNEPPPQGGLLPNGERRVFSPMASTLIYGSQDAVLTDPGMTFEQARALGDRIAAKSKNLTDIFVTHGHGDHWFATGLLAERFGASGGRRSTRSRHCGRGADRRRSPEQAARRRRRAHGR